MELVWIPLILALAGGIHCAGMCGGFAVLVSQRETGAIPTGFLLYGAGKTVMYAVLGAAVGFLGVAAAAHSFAGRILSVAAGLVLIGAGLAMAGVRFGSGAGSGRWVTRPAEMLGRYADRGRFTLGLINGLLPCSLLYAALAAAAATGSGWRAMAFMALFGAATLPALWLSVRVMRRLDGRIRLRLSRLTGILVVLFGVITLLRATPLPELLLGHGH